jgi:hypothetical protein
MTRNPIRSLAARIYGVVCLTTELLAAQLLEVGVTAGAGDWIPGTDADLDTFALNFSAILTANPTAYGLTAGDATALATLVNAYDAALGLATDPSTRTPATIAAKDAAKNAMKPQLRADGVLIRANPAVSDDAKIAIGVTVPDVKPTPIIAPTSFPLLSVLSATPFNHNLKVTDSDTPTTNAKPAGAIALEFRAQVSATAIADPGDIAYAGLETGHLVNKQFESGDVGKKCYYAGRWITRTGLVGPWSDITSFTVAA